MWWPPRRPARRRASSRRRPACRGAVSGRRQRRTGPRRPPRPSRGAVGAKNLSAPARPAASERRSWPRPAPARTRLPRVENKHQSPFVGRVSEAPCPQYAPRASPRRTPICPIFRLPPRPGVGLGRGTAWALGQMARLGFFERGNPPWGGWLRRRSVQTSPGDPQLLLAPHGP
jgi:hypothetical protein